MNWTLVLIGFCVMAVAWGCLELIPQHRLHGWVDRTLEVGFFCGFVVAMVGSIPVLWEVEP